MAEVVMVSLDPASVEPVAETLQAGATQRRRAAGKVAAELERERLDGRDIRTGSLKVVRLLAEADALELAAEAVKEAPTFHAFEPGGPVLEPVPILMEGPVVRRDVFEIHGDDGPMAEPAT